MEEDEGMTQFAAQLQRSGVAGVSGAAGGDTACGWEEERWTEGSALSAAEAADVKVLLGGGEPPAQPRVVRAGEGKGRLMHACPILAASKLLCLGGLGGFEGGGRAGSGCIQWCSPVHRTSRRWDGRRVSVMCWVRKTPVLTHSPGDQAVLGGGRGGAR